MIKIKYQLYQQPREDLSAEQQILLNRGIPLEEQKEWLAADENDFYDWRLLGERKMRDLAEVLVSAILKDEDVIVIVDSDCDGLTSTAILANYLYKQYPDWTEEHLKFIDHEGKQHGFNDVLDEILEINDKTPISIAITPDGGSNDIEAHRALYDAGIYNATLDHHIVEDMNSTDPYCNVINVQLSNYPNKALTGAGVVWKFCQCMDEYLNENPGLLGSGKYADDFMDLVAIGNLADMSDYHEKETRAIMNVGLRQMNNRFLKGLAAKNEYVLNKRNGLNYLSCAFGIAPFINCMFRSGTMEEKEILLDSFLDYRNDKLVPSTKRGHKGEEVHLWEEGVLTTDRVKRRQTKLQDEAVDLVKDRIEEEGLDKHSIIVIKCEKGEIAPSLAGLLANKIQSKYRHPCLVLTHIVDENGEIVYSGSGRNISNSPIEDLKDFIVESGYANFCAGHYSAFGASFPEQQVDPFVNYFDNYCKKNNIEFEPIYDVDYVWGPADVSGERIKEIAKLNIYGQGIPESYVALKGIPLNKENVQLLGAAKGNPTLKLQLDKDGANVIQFKSSEREFEEWTQGGQVIDIVGKCNINEWQGNVTPQIIVEDYQLRQEWVF